MTVAKAKPPTFPYLPKKRARQLKKSWVEHHKIRSKWKAQKRREGLTNQTSAPVGDTPNHALDRINVRSEPDTSPGRPEKSIAPSHDDKQSLRDLRRIAYTSKPFSAQNLDLSHRRKTPGVTRSGKATAGRKTGQPNMKLRMNVLLEKIKRDLS